MLTVNTNEHMWEQRFRPTTLEECILPKSDKAIFADIIKSGKLPHMILHSASPGTGKTTLAKALCYEINADMLFVNGSDCRIDFVRNDLTRFASSVSMDGKPKVIVIDEFDRPGLAESQRHLRTFMETYSKNCTIIMTANNIEGIIEPLRSRSRVIKFGTVTNEDHVLMMKSMIMRCVDICKEQSVKIEDMKVIAALVKKNFPDFRKTINTLDFYSSKGVIDSGILSVIMNDSESIDDVINALKTKNVKDLRALAPKYATDYASFVQKLTNSLYELVSKTSIIRMYEIVGESNQYMGIAGNIELHITYMLIQLTVEMEWK